MDSYEADLVAQIHGPGNAPIHDRLAAPIVERLVPVVRAVIADGIGDGSFIDQDPGRAAAFVLATYASLHDLVASPAELVEVTRDLDRFILRGLGYTEAG